MFNPAVTTKEKQDLLNDYKQLINIALPGKYQSPVKYNHCFNRIILDWLFQDCWYNHLNRNKSAYSQLSQNQLQLMVGRMQLWLKDLSLLKEDNLKSIRFRAVYKSKN